MSWGAIGFAISLATGSLSGLVCDVYGALAFVVAVAFSGRLSWWLRFCVDDG